ncbi:hypothetical protein SO694_00042128 [Aureococcus anophagefferens]|uniref:J domain-containing protein n=1 Tax=Aureococcus anophagefferens TaxID=44056 RepID=A0ABR1G6C5_AURAN
MASTREKHLSALGVAKHADAPTIKKAFKKLALKHHPDRNPDNVAEATERFKVVNEAYTYLTSTAGRASQPRRAREFARAAAAEEAVARKKAEEAQAAEAEQRERSAEQERRWDAALSASANAAEAELRARLRGREGAPRAVARRRRRRRRRHDGGRRGLVAREPRGRRRSGRRERLYERTQAQLRRNRDARAAKEAAAAKGDDWSTADQDAFYAQCCDAAAAVLGKGGSRRDPASPAGEELDRLLRAFGKRKVGLTPTPDEVAADRPRQRQRDAPRTFVAGADGAVRPARRPGQREPGPYGAAGADREPRPYGGDREPRPYGSDAPATPRAGVAMPTYVRVVGVAATSIELEWAPGAGEAAWQLQWSKDGGLTWDAAPRTLEAPRCRKRNLPPDTLVIFRVRAVAGGDASAWATVEGRTALQRSSKAGTASAFAAAVADEIPGESPTKSEGDAADGVNDAFARAQSWAADQADREAWAPSEKWHELVEEDSGQKFFWNEATGETRWDADPGWALRVDGDGAEYYVPGRRRRSRRPSSSQADDGAAGGSRSKRPSLDGRFSSMRSRLNSVFGARPVDVKASG